MLLRINPSNVEWRKIHQIVDILKNGGIIIYPTDTVYGLGCDINNQKAVEKICRLRDLDHKTANLSFICKDIGQIASYTKTCLLYTSPSPRDRTRSRMPSSA